ncbi:FecR family protein [Carboxylicivirga taeanensis]|uniref:FecR family protein n=1 Tax=Carboxylicivirga taeanensis TaxID=1416875 RepID=UPI003F6E1510
MKNSTPFEVADIVAKLLKGQTLNDDEEKRFNDWISSDQANELLFEQLKNSAEFDAYLAKTEKINVEQALNSVYSRSANKPSGKRVVMRWVAYAAAIVLPLLLVWSAYNWSNKAPIEGGVALEQSGIQPGGSKAVLYLANGNQIELDMVGNQVIEEDDGTLIETTNQEIKYNEAGGQTAAQGSSLKNTIFIPRKGEFTLTLADGTKVWLNSETTLEYPTQFGADKREVNLTGEAFFEVTKDAARPFIVNVKGVAVKVLGTSFNVQAYGKENTVTTTLVTGKVMLESQLNKAHQEVILQPGMQSIISEQEKIVINQVDPLLYAAWKDGEFRFENKPLEEILESLQRWYDVEIVYENQAMKTKRFTGDLKRYAEINTHLDMISLTTNVQFEIKNHIVYVR